MADVKFKILALQEKSEGTDVLGEVLEHLQKTTLDEETKSNVIEELKAGS